MVGPRNVYQLAARRFVGASVSSRVHVFPLTTSLGCYHQPLPSSALFSCLSSPLASPSSAISHSPGSGIDFAPSRRRVLFIGDSSVRLLFFAAVRLVDGGKGGVPAGWETDGMKHTDRKLVFNNGGRPEAHSEMEVELEFWW